MGHCPGNEEPQPYRGTRPTVVSRNKHVTCGYTGPTVEVGSTRLDKARFATGFARERGRTGTGVVSLVIARSRRRGCRKWAEWTGSTPWTAGANQRSGVAVERRGWLTRIYATILGRDQDARNCKERRVALPGDPWLPHLKPEQFVVTLAAFGPTSCPSCPSSFATIPFHYTCPRCPSHGEDGRSYFVSISDR